MSATLTHATSFPTSSSTLLRLLRFLLARAERRNAIAELEQLQDHHLRDIGLDRSDIGAKVDAAMRSIERARLLAGPRY